MEDEDFIAFDMEDEPEEAETSQHDALPTQSHVPVSVDDTIREHAAARSTPWALHVPWHKCRNVAEMLHEEIKTYSSWICPTREEHAVRVMVIELLQNALCSEWPDAQVLSFGSQDTQLYLPQGDIDLVVLSQTMDARPRETTLRGIAACLRSHKLAKDIQVIARAKVPIIKFVCPYGHFHVDISINQANGLQAARLVNRWLIKQPAIRPLVMVVKQFLQQRALSEVFTGGLGSYSVTLMVLSFLQVHPKLQRAEIDASKNLGTLLMEFLELYGKNFGYDETGITVRGRGGYFNKRQRGSYDTRKPFLLCIEDPHDPSNDISKGSFAIISVRSALGGAYDILHAALCERANDLHNFRRRQRIMHDRQQKNTHKHFDPNDEDDRLHIASELKEPESLLGSVLGVSREMIKRRTEIKQLYDAGTLQQRLAELQPTEPTQAETNCSEADHSVDKAETTQSSVPTVVSSSDSDTPVLLHVRTKPKRRVVEESPDTSMESRYRPAKTKKRAARDPWSERAHVAAAPPSDSDEDALLSGDAPFVAEVSDSDAPPEASTPLRKAQRAAASVLAPHERRKTSKLNKQARMDYWHAKAMAPSQDYSSP
ncbi:poly(A) RNA polymerase [Malassezia pachydermatis]